MKTYDVITVGGGPAGLTAALYASRAGARVAVIESLVLGGTSAATPKNQNYPGYESISGFELSQKIAAQAQGSGAEIIYGEVVGILDGNEKTVTLKSGEVYACKALILCTGSTPRKIGIAGEDKLIGAGLSYCATCDGNFYRNKSVAVYGAGNHALSAAKYLKPIVGELIVISPTAAVKTECAASYGNARITGLTGNPLSAVKFTANGEEKVVNVSGLFVELGTVPANGLSRGLAETDKAGYIICDGKMQTSAAGIFAAGDSVSKPLRQIVTAAADGAVAGQFAAAYARKNA